MSGDEILVDARGLLCPWPVLRLSRAARTAGGVGRIRLLADDLATADEVAQLCAERGWSLEQQPDGNGSYLVLLS